MGDGLGWGDGAGDGDGDGDGRIDGRIEGEPDGLGDGDGLGDAVAEGDGWLHAPWRNGSCESLPQPTVTPGGRAYHSRMPAGSGLMNRFMIVTPTFSP